MSTIIRRLRQCGIDSERAWERSVFDRLLLSALRFFKPRRTPPGRVQFQPMLTPARQARNTTTRTTTTTEPLLNTCLLRLFPACFLCTSPMPWPNRITASRVVRSSLRSSRTTGCQRCTNESTTWTQASPCPHRSSLLHLLVKQRSILQLRQRRSRPRRRHLRRYMLPPAPVRHPPVASMHQLLAHPSAHHHHQTPAQLDHHPPLLGD